MARGGGGVYVTTRTIMSLLQGRTLIRVNLGFEMISVVNRGVPFEVRQNKVVETLLILTRI